MAQVTDAQLTAAEANGREILAKGPRATKARYDLASGRVSIELGNGCCFAFPPLLVEDLQGADAGDLARVEVDGGGLNLHWPTLAVDLYVPALVAGVFGTSAWMARIAERGPAAPEARAAGGKEGRARKAARG